MKKAKKLMALLLACAMIPAYAATAAEENAAEAGSEVELRAAAANGGNILLTDNFSVTGEPIEITADTTIDLNGHTITNSVQNNRLFNVTAAVEFTIDGKAAGSAMTIPEENTASYGFVKITNAATVTMDGGNYTGNTDDGALIKTFEGSDGVVINLYNVNATTNNRFYTTASLNSLGGFNVKGGTYTTTFAQRADGNKNYGLAVFCINADEQTDDVIFENVTVNAALGPVIEVVCVNAIFNNCTFDVKGTENSFNNTAIGVSYDGSATINGGSYISEGYSTYIFNSGGKVTVNDGTFEGGKAVVKADVREDGVPAVVRLNDGTFKGEIQTGGSGQPIEILVAGGKFDDETAKQYMSAGAKVEENQDGTFTVTSTVVAKIGDISYYSITDAIASANDNDTVIILDGSYDENVIIDPATVAKGVVIKGEDEKYPTLTGGIKFSKGSAKGMDLTIQGLTVDCAQTGKGIDLVGWTQTINLDEVAALTITDNKFLNINGNNYAIHINNSDNAINNLTVTNNVFSGAESGGKNGGLYATTCGKVTVTGNEFNNIGFNPITLIGKDNSSHAITSAVISGNKFNEWAVWWNSLSAEEQASQDHDGRAMRLSYFVDGTNVDLTENVFICTNPPEEYIKANGVAPGANVDLNNCYWGGNEPTVGEGAGKNLFFYNTDKTEVLPSNAMTYYEDAAKETLAVTSNAVAKVGDVYFSTLQDAVEAAKNGGTAEVLQDSTVDVWNQVWDFTGTIKGNGHTVTVNSIYSNGNGNYMFYNATNTTVSDLTIELKGGNAAFDIESGTLKNITVIGGTYAVLTGGNSTATGTPLITIDGCTFKDQAMSVYTSEHGNVYDVVIKDCKFDSNRPIILRGNEQFINNTVTTKEKMTINKGAAATVTGNTFTEGSTLKLYNVPDTIIKDNRLSEIELDTNASATLDANYWYGKDLSTVNLGNIKVLTYYEDAEMTKLIHTANAVAQVSANGSVSYYATLAEAFVAVNAMPGTETVTLTISSGEFAPTANDQLRVERANVIIEGASVDKTTIACGEFSCSGQAGILIGADNVTLKNLTVTSTSTNGNVAAVKVTYLGAGEAKLLENCVLENLNISSDKGHGLNIHGASGCEVTDVTISNSGKCAVALANAKGITLTGSTLNGSWGDIGMMYGAGSAYENPCELTLGANNTFGKGLIYADPRDDEKVNIVILDAHQTVEIAGAEVVEGEISHVWDNGTVTTPATCTEKGEKTFACTIAGCKEKKTEEIEMLPHTVVTDVAVAATCTATGLTEGAHCSVCNTVLTAQTTVDALGHSYAYAANRNVITETCANGCDHSATATLTAEGGRENGSNYTAKISYSDNWVGNKDTTIVYTLDGKTVTATREAGDYTAAITIGDATATTVFSVTKRRTSSSNRPSSSGGITTIVTKPNDEVTIDDGDVPLSDADSVINDNPTNSFADVQPADWYYDAINYVCGKKLMNGLESNLFGVNEVTTRGMIVTILHRLEGEPAAETANFTDVAPGQYYTNAVAWAAENGIVEGFDSTTFGPDNSITREQFAAILYRYAAHKGYNVENRTDITGYTDAEQVSAYATEAMQWAVAEKLISGMTETTLVPSGDAVRVQAAAILARFCQNIAK